MSRAGFPGLVEEAIARFGHFHMTARGQSMRPFIPDGSLITLGPVRGAVRPGDVVAIDLGARLVVHRVMLISTDWVQTVGDGNRKVDTRRPIANIIGMVERIELPNGWSQRMDTHASRFLGRLIICVHRHLSARG